MTDANDQPIGQQLRQAREARRMTLEQAAFATRIRQRYLEAMEVGDFSVFPSSAQASGFLRAYARYLELDEAALPDGFGGEEALRPAAPPPAPARSSTSTESTSQAESIFAQIGQKLRGQRELLGLSLDDVERHTHLRVHYLEALESGDLDYLPSPVQARGMLANYASFLGLETDALLLSFAEGLQARLAMRRAEQPRRKRRPARPYTKPPSPLRYLLSADLIISGIVIVFLLGFVAWGAMRVSRMRAAQSPTPSAPAIADVLSTQPGLPPTETTGAYQSPTPPGAPGGGEVVAQDTPQLTLPAFGGEAVQVYVVVQQRTWMRVLVDGAVKFEGRVAPGSAYPFAGDDRVEVLTGNGAALQVFYNQADLGLLGDFGQVVNLIFTVTGPQTPTATITPTPSPTPLTTPTLTPTPGGSPTPAAAP